MSKVKVITTGECYLNSAIAQVIFPLAIPYHGQSQSQTIGFVNRTVNKPKGRKMYLYAIVDVEDCTKSRDKCLRFKKLADELKKLSEEKFTSTKDSKVPGILGNAFLIKKDNKEIYVFLIGFNPDPEELIRRYGDRELKKLINDSNILRVIKSEKVLEYVKKYVRKGNGCPTRIRVCKIVNFLAERVEQVIGVLKREISKY